MANEKVISGKTISEWITHETRKQVASLWGSEVEFEPVLCSKIVGDGQQLIYFGSIDNRPYFWLIRIDGATDIEADDFNYEELIHLVEGNCGRHPGFVVDEEEFNNRKKDPSDWEVQDIESFDHYKSLCEYPALWWGMGGHWGLIVNFSTEKTG